jgi:hypothetical protein
VILWLARWYFTLRIVARNKLITWRAIIMGT